MQPDLQVGRSRRSDMRFRSRLAVWTIGAFGLTGLLTSTTLAQQRAAAPPAPTFSKDVAPILQKSCDNCHRPGSIGPMSLLTYQDARPWARSIRTRVEKREMPPWYIDRHVGVQQFLDDPSLSDAEISTIVKWVDAGAP